MTEEFTKEERELIQPFFTNLDKPIFALKNLPEVVRGALFSRYSRSDKTLRRLLIDEFIQNPEMGFKEIVNYQEQEGEDEVIAIKKAEEFYDRVLVGYGDDSVAELGGAHIAVENVSNIATKVLEDARIGISPLEKSSRYIYFNKKVNGEYKFYRDPEIMKSEFADEYVDAMNSLFDTYSELVEPMKEYLMEKNPQSEDVSDRAYKFSIKAKACDTLRILLPASTLTNVGMYGNGRAFEYLITKMNAMPLQEMQDIAGSMHEELSKTIPSFVKRSTRENKYGAPYIEYFEQTHKAMQDLTSKVLHDQALQIPREEVELIDFDENAEDKVLTSMLYPYTNLPMTQVMEKVKSLSAEERKEIIKEYLSRRENRRHKPLRALENAYYTFDILGNFGIYRDLQRHRMLTQERQDLTTAHGYDMPQEIIDAGFEDQVRTAMTKASDCFNKIHSKLPKQAQYAVPFGYKIRWYNTLNLREVYHKVELRTIIQGHPDYRRICQKMFTAVQDKHPALVEYAKYVNMTTPKELERLESEKRQDEKQKQVNEKYSKKSEE